MDRDAALEQLAARRFDLLVVGGGPAGLHAAECLARRGASTLVCEEHSNIGDPVHCTGILASDSFDVLGLPRDATAPPQPPVPRERGVDEIGFTEHVYYFEQTHALWPWPPRAIACCCTSATTSPSTLIVRATSLSLPAITSVLMFSTAAFTASPMIVF